MKNRAFYAIKLALLLYPFAGEQLRRKHSDTACAEQRWEQTSTGTEMKSVVCSGWEVQAIKWQEMKREKMKLLGWSERILLTCQDTAVTTAYGPDQREDRKETWRNCSCPVRIRSATRVGCWRGGGCRERQRGTWKDWQLEWGKEGHGWWERRTPTPVPAWSLGKLADGGAPDHAGQQDRHVCRASRWTSLRSWICSSEEVD